MTYRLGRSPAASPNGSGVASTLRLARYLVSRSVLGLPAKRKPVLELEAYERPFHCFRDDFVWTGFDPDPALLDRAELGVYLVPHAPQEGRRPAQAAVHLLQGRQG